MTTQPQAAPYDLATFDAFKPCTLQLEQPVTWAKQDYTELTFRPATGRAIRHLTIRKAPGTGDQIIVMDDILKVAAQLAGVPDAVILELGGRDLARTIEITTGFLEPLQ